MQTRKPNRRIRLAIRTSKSIMERRIKRYLKMQETIIQKYGFLVQAVHADEGSFSYTIGRMRSFQPELLLLGFNNHTHGLIDEVVERLGKNNIQLYKPFQANKLVCLKNNEPTWAILVHATLKDIQTKMLGIHKEIRDNEGMVLPPLKIIIADSRNRLPPNLRTDQDIVSANFKGTDFTLNIWPKLVNHIRERKPSK